MESVLANLFNGKICPFEQLAPAYKAYKQTMDSFWETQEEFSSGLTEIQKQKFEEIMDKFIETSPMEETQSFINGFKLGAQIIFEVFFS